MAKKNNQGNVKKAQESLKKPIAKRSKRGQNKDDKQFDDVELPQNQEMDQEQLDSNQENNEDADDSENDDSESQNSDEDQDDDDDDDDDQQSSISEIKPQNMAIRQMSYRERRGTKMTALINRKKQEQQDSFLEQYKGFFGCDLDAPDDEEEEDYVQSGSGRDQFDSDFGASESDHGEEQEENKKMDEVDEEVLKQRKRRAELMKKVNAPTTPKPQQKKKIIKKQSSKKQIKVQPTNRYIHQMFTQQELLGEAAQTQYINWLSLKKLISIQTQKKDFTRKQKHIEGTKIIYRDSIKQNPQREVTYELVGVQINEIQDLTEIWNKK